MNDEYNIEEQLAKTQFRLLGKGFGLEHHLETVKKLPTEIKLRHYEKLLQGKWISEEQYNTFIRE